MLRAVWWRHRRDARRVCDGSVDGPLAGAHVAEGRVLAVVGVSGALVLVLVLRAGGGGVGGAVVLQVEGGVAGMLWGSLAVVAGTQLLRLDLSPLLGWLATQ